MNKLRCIIVDDEPIARRGMRRLIDMHPQLEAVGWAANTKDTEKLLSSSDFEVDLIFLDVDMDEESGLDFARRLDRKYMVIFSTAFSEYALESYEVEAVDYLLKPIRAERFNKAVAKAIEKNESFSSESSHPVISEPVITVKADRKFIRIPLKDILYVEGLGDYLVMHLSDRRLTTRMTFKALMETLPAKDFMRVNKSYVVNISKVDSFNSQEIKIGEITIPIGGIYRETVMQTLGK